MKVTVKAALLVAIGTAAGCGVLNIEAAEAASVKFSYDYVNDALNSTGLDLLLEGTVEGDIVGNQVTNLTNLVATLTDKKTPSAGTFGLKFVNGATQNFTLNGSGLLLSFQELTDANVTTRLNLSGAGGLFAQSQLPGPIQSRDITQGIWNAQVQTSTEIPTPALLPGLMLMGGALRRRLRRNSEEAA